VEIKEHTARFRWPHAFRALHQRNLRFFLFGQLIALSGTQLQIATLNWLIYQLTDSPLMLGLVNFIALLPVGLVALVGGVISDYFPSRKLILVTRVTRSLQALVLVTLTLIGWIQVWHIMILVFIGAAVDTIELPTYYVFLTDLVEEEDYSNVIALNASAFNTGRIVGPAVAGLLIGWVGETSCFLLSGFSSLVFIAFLLSIRLQAWTKPTKPLRLTGNLLEGLKYIWHDQSIKSLLALVAVSCFLAQSYVVLLPVFARDVLHSNARGYGLLMSALGVSAVCGTLIVASLKAGHRRKWLIGASIAFSFFLVLFSLSQWLPLSVGLALFVGASQIIQRVLAASLLQIIALKEFRGRVASFFGLLNNGLTRLGGLQVSALSQYVNAPFAIQVGAVLSLVWVLLAVWRMPFWRRLSRAP
jgi:MFS family permease